MKKNTNYRKRGVTIIWAMVIMTALCMIMSLAIDYGHAQLVKTELRRTADASARAAAAYIYSDLSQGTAAAIDIASKNQADGAFVKLAASDIQFGNWDVNSKKFTKTKSSSMINAVQVVARKKVPMLLAKILGRDSCDAQAEAVVMAIKPINVDDNVSAKANPFLAGMPPGSVASKINPENTPNYAGTPDNPLNSPLAVDMPITQFASYTFDSISGTANHNPNLLQSNPDGDLNDPSDPIGHNNVSLTHENNYGPTMYNENGIADAWIPINAIVGVFLDDDQPNLERTPPNLDYRTDASRNQDVYAPQLKQIFYIGDGLNSKGQHQQFVAPMGASRLYIAMMDYYNWDNNGGFRIIKVNRPGQIILVK